MYVYVDAYADVVNTDPVVDYVEVDSELSIVVNGVNVDTDVNVEVCFHVDVYVYSGFDADFHVGVYIVSCYVD